MALFEPLFQALEAAQVRYVVVGGLAVVLHGHARLTADVDLIVDLTPAEARRAVDALGAFGLVPRPPVALPAFADPGIRRSWIRDKGMQVLSLHDPRNPLLEVDLFVESPIPFGELWARAETVALAGSTVRVAAIRDLVTMKRLAGRRQDLEDIEALEEIERRRGGGDG